MPELPEVEVVRRGADACVRGRRLRAVELKRHDLRWPIPVEAVRGLAGRRCRAIERRSKFLLMRMDGDGCPTALVHLGMSGRLFVDVLARGAVEPEWRKHEHWRMQFDGGRLMRFVDPRRFGSLDLATAEELPFHPHLIHLGPEPLSSDFDGDYLFERTRRRKVATKSFLMDAKNVVGVGNIYASESCFYAGVRPRRRAATLSKAECERLGESVKDVLTAAIEAGGTTLRDYVGVDEGTGYFQRELAVYGRAGEPCRVCDATIKHVQSGQRSTYYCASCQA